MLKKVVQTIVEQHYINDRGDKCTRMYAKGRLLGQGGCASCYELTDMENDKKYAAKIINKSTLNKKSAKEKLIQEIQIQRSLDHVNILKI